MRRGRRRAPSRSRRGRSRRRRASSTTPSSIDDRPPAGGRDDLEALALGARDEDREVAVPAEAGQRAADRRVDVAVGELRGAERDRERLGEQRARLERLPARAVERSQLGVVPEAAAGEVDRGQLVLDRGDGRVERGRIGDADLGGRAERVERPGRDRHAHDPPDVVDGCALDVVTGCDGALSVGEVDEALDDEEEEEELELDVEGDAELELVEEMPELDEEGDVELELGAEAEEVVVEVEVDDESAESESPSSVLTAIVRVDAAFFAAVEAARAFAVESTWPA